MEDKCICCGATIPEGGWVCVNCLSQLETEDDNENNKVSQSSV